MFVLVLGYVDCLQFVLIYCCRFPVYGDAMYQGDLSERGLDDRWHDSNHHWRQLLRRFAGGVRHNARLERGENSTALWRPLCY